MSVHLIHVGFPKTGSMYLRSWFSSHPAIEYVPEGFGGYASVGDLIRRATGTTDPQSKARVTSSEALSAPTRDRPNWGRMPQAQVAVCEALHDLFPHAHILIVTRGYGAIIESGHSQLVRVGGAQSFGEFVQSPDVLDILPDILNYDRFAAEYRRLFDGRVTVLPYELLRDDHRAFLGIIESVLGVGRHAASPLAENVRLRPEELRWYPRIASMIARMPVGGRVQRRLYSLHASAIASGKMRPVAGLLDRLRRSPDQPPAHIPEELLKRVRSGARMLVTEQWHRPYAAEYLG